MFSLFSLGSWWGVDEAVCHGTVGEVDKHIKLVVRVSCGCCHVLLLYPASPFFEPVSSKRDTAWGIGPLVRWCMLHCHRPEPRAPRRTQRRS